MSDNDQELLKLETEIYHSDGGIYFAECDTATTRDEIARRLENRFFNKNAKVIKINVRMTGVASTRDEIARWLDNVSLAKDGKKSELDVQANDLTYTVSRYHGNDAAFFVYLPSEKSELEELARILNYTREEFAEVKQPIIIWADKVSIGVVARYAPDFWAWRARVSKFNGSSCDSEYKGGIEVAETVWREKISDEEIQAYKRALEEFKDRGDEKEVVKILGHLGILYYRRGEWDLAIEYYEKDMELSEALRDRRGLAQTYNNLGLVYVDKGKWDLAIEYYRKSMAIFEDIEDQYGLASTYTNLGSLHFHRGEWHSAIEWYKKNIEIKKSLKDQYGLATTYGNLGSVYYRKGERNRAIEYYEKSMEIFEDLEDHQYGISQIYGNIGLVYADKGEWDIAIEYYEKSIKIKKDLEDRQGIAKIYGNLGSLHFGRGEWDLAIEYYKNDLVISKSIGDQQGVGVSLANIGSVHLNQFDPASAKEKLEDAIKKIHPDTRPHYPNALSWLAVSLRMIADQKKHKAKLTSSDVDRAKLVSDAAELYREAGERYEETHGLPLARMLHSLMMDAHLTRGLSYSVQNITEEDADAAISLLDRAIEEMESALEFADGAAAIRLEGAIASHRAKRCVREIGLHRDDVKKQDELLDEAISRLGEAAGSFGSLGDAGACSSKTCDGCRHLYTALGLIRDGYRNKSNQKIVDAVSEIRSAEECYQGISNELGTGVVDQVNEILRRVADNLKNMGEFDPGGAVDAANDVFDALDEISGVGLRNMIKILVFDEAGNVTERDIPTMRSSGGNSAKDSGVIFSGDIGGNAAISINTGNEPPPDKRKSISMWDYVLGAVGGILTGIISAISMSLYFEEPIKNFRMPAIIICIIMLSLIIYARYRISNSNA